MKIYVASSWRNNYQHSVVKYLKKEGFKVYDFKNPTTLNNGFSWSDIDPKWMEWTPEEFIKALDHPIAINGFDFDFDAMKWADICVMVLPCGRSAHTEAGWMAGMNKKVYIYTPEPCEPELMYKIYDGISTDLTNLKIKINQGD